MAGIAGHVAETGSIAFAAMRADIPAHWLILAGFLLNAASWPLSAWLPDAYPEASWSGTVFLSAFTTKTAVLVLLRGFPGEEILIVVGLAMIFYGIVYAILENDMRRILAYSIVNQVGFMVTGIGIGSEMALNGAAAHAFVHIIYKALLLMSAGSVLLMTGRRKCSVLAVVGQLVTARVPQHVAGTGRGIRRPRQHEQPCADSQQRSTGPIARTQTRMRQACPRLTLERAQRPYLLCLDRMDARATALRAAHMKLVPGSRYRPSAAPPTHWPRSPWR